MGYLKTLGSPWLHPRTLLFHDHGTSTTHTDGQTDRQTIYDRNTALCTRVHRGKM